MMIINGSFPGQAVYQKTVNLTAGTDVLFEYWVHNMDDPIYGQAAFIPAILGAQIKSGSTIIANIS